MARRYTQETLDRAKALHAQGLSIQALSLELNIPTERLYTWRQKGWKMAPPPAPRPIPDDFAEQCQLKTITDLAADYKASPNTVRKWLAQMPEEVQNARHFNLGVIMEGDGHFKRVGRPVPQDFEGIFLQLGARNAAAHYVVSEHQIDHWLRHRPELRQRRREILDNMKNTGRGRALSRLQRFGQQTAMTLVDNAAHYLRRFKRQVYEPAKIMVRAGFKNGHALYRPMGPEGFHYVDGRGLIPTEEMLEMARQHGWQS